MGTYGTATGLVQVIPAAGEPGKLLGLLDGELQAYFDSDGKIKWAGDKGVLDASGITWIDSFNRLVLTSGVGIVLNIETQSDGEFYAVRATATAGTGVSGYSVSGVGIDAQSASGTGLNAISDSGTAVDAESSSGTGGHFQGGQNGVYGLSSSEGGVGYAGVTGVGESGAAGVYGIGYGTKLLEEVIPGDGGVIAEGEAASGTPALVIRNGIVDGGSQRYTALADATSDTDALNRQTGDARYAPLAGSQYTNVIIVDVTAGRGDYTSVKAACDYVATQSPSSTNKWLIEIMPGDYIEDPFTVPTYTLLRGKLQDPILGSPYGVQILPSADLTSGNYITLANYAGLEAIGVTATMSAAAGTACTVVSSALAQINRSYLYVRNNSTTFTLTTVKGTFTYVAHSVLSINTAGSGAVIHCHAQAGGGFQIKYSNFASTSVIGSRAMLIEADSTCFYNRIGNTTGTTFPVDIEVTGGTLYINNTPYKTSATSGAGTVVHHDRFYPTSAGVREAPTATDTPLTLTPAAGQTADLVAWPDGGIEADGALRAVTVYSDTVAEDTAAAGVTVDTLLIKDGSLTPPADNAQSLGSATADFANGYIRNLISLSKLGTNTLYVDPLGTGTYTTLSAALAAAAALTPSTTNEVLIIVTGEVAETAALTALSHVHVLFLPGASVTVTATATVNGVNFASLTNTTWAAVDRARPHIIRAGVLASAAAHAVFTTGCDSTVRLTNIYAANNTTGQNNCHGIYNALNSNPTLTGCTGKGGDGGTGCAGIRNNVCTPVLIDCTGSGGNGGATCHGIYNSAGAPLLQNCIGIGGNGGASCFGIHNNTSAAATVEHCIGRGGGAGQNNATVTVAASSRTEDTYQPSAAFPYRLIGAIYLSVSAAAAAGVTITFRDATGGGGNALTAAVAVDSTGSKYIPLTGWRVIAAGNLFYGALSASDATLAYTMQYVYTIEYTTCYGLYDDSNARQDYVNSIFVSNGASAAVYVTNNGDDASIFSGGVARSGMNSGTRSKAIQCQSAWNPGQVYNMTLDGGSTNLTPAPQPLSGGGGLLAPYLRPAADAAAAVTLQNAAGTAIVTAGTVGGVSAVGLYGVTAVARATTAGSAATFSQLSGNAVNDASTFDGYTLGQIVKALRDIGVLT